MRSPRLPVGILAPLCLVAVTAGQVRDESPSLAHVQGRHTTALDGRWHVIVDPYDTGYYDYRGQPTPDGYFRNAKPRSPSDLIEYDFDAAPQLNVPGDWNTQDQRLLFYEGAVWYKRSFDYQPAERRRVFVTFGAANYVADVYLNGQGLGRHVGGFTPFNFEITGRLRPRDNFLIVRVDNRRRPEGVPTLSTDWWNYGGLTREVALVEVPDTFIQDYFLQQKPGSTDEIAGWVELAGPAAARQAVSIEIPEAGVKHVVETRADGYAPVSITARLDLWTPEQPRLYRVTLSAGEDAIEESLGFRHIATRGTDILLNGKPVFLRGICIHEESPLRGGRAFSEDDARMLLTWAKELGCNFVRLAHYPHNEHMTRLADRMGLLVWSEIPVYWTIQFDNPETFENARGQLGESITRDKNRASVILWSVANETPLGEPRLRFLKGLIDEARRLDPTRLVTAAMERHAVGGETQMIDDPLGQYLDVLGCNEYIGWYDGLPEKADRVKWATVYDKPLVMSELGGGALFGYHGDPGVRWTEEYQKRLYEHQLRMLEGIPFLRGISPWILTDFRSPRRPLSGIQDYYNRKGLISSRGERKQAFYVLQEFYRELARAGR